MYIIYLKQLYGVHYILYIGHIYNVYTQLVKQLNLPQKITSPLDILRHH